MNQSRSPTKYKVDKDGSDSQQSPPVKNSISVHSTGEVISYPDIIQFKITIQSSKDTLEDAQASVKRRTDYVAQVIRKNGIRNNDVTVSTLLNRRHLESGEATECSTDMVVNCDSLSRCEIIRNVLIEKMDSSVLVSAVSFLHTAEAREVGSQEAFKKAVLSAKAKAECISQTVEVQLGSAIQVREVPQDSSEKLVPKQENPMGGRLDLYSNRDSLYQRYTDAAETFISHVFVCFETHPIRLCNHKKCHKH